MDPVTLNALIGVGLMIAGNVLANWLKIPNPFGPKVPPVTPTDPTKPVDPATDPLANFPILRALRDLLLAGKVDSAKNLAAHVAADTLPDSLPKS